MVKKKLWWNKEIQNLIFRKETKKERKEELKEYRRRKREEKEQEDSILKFGTIPAMMGGR